MTETDHEQSAQWLPIEQENNPRLDRDIVFDYLRTAGVDRLYGVPGTNEIPLIDGTDVPENRIEYVLCLHENIALGAAMGYARHRRTGSGDVVPGVVGLHVTPGVGHAIGNLFNASRSHSPLLVLCAGWTCCGSPTTGSRAARPSTSNSTVSPSCRSWSRQRASVSTAAWSNPRTTSNRR
ncbi:thiamine pyrophosphate-binding protein [Saccharopolyspora kobensis]|uniref:thiamine pyrophosphate-binding protein n=1 Tax=Saccharopolyspora kobensis TaxID=146035 RepID=UPI001C42FF1D|nr:thiamine pyrophosphate-binding protein [Saccharopolyspora kobensis]